MKGNCNCNNVSFEITANMSKLYQCHCTLCQKQSGSTSNTATIIHESSFQWLSGEDSITHWRKESGFTSDFCKVCGSPVPNKLRDTGFIWIPMGLIDDVDAKIVVHLCCSSKARWDSIQGNAEMLDDMPESIGSFIESLQSKGV